MLADGTVVGTVVRNGNYGRPPAPSHDYTRIIDEDVDRIDFIESGGQGSVYRGTWNNGESVVEVAIKIATHTTPELSVLQRVRHKNIVHFYGAIEKAGHPPQIVMELAEFGSLFKVIKSEELGFEQILKFSRNIAAGLNYLHTGMVEKIIHRDLKSKNVLITQQWVAKICDFGSSKVTDATHCSMTTRQGTPSWMAPEVIQQKRITEKCDTYSFGCLLWEMVTREIPWRNMEAQAIMMAVAFHKKRPPIPEQCPKHFADLIRNCWQHDPEKRYTIEKISFELNGMISNKDLSIQVDHFIQMRDQWMKVVDEQMEELKLKEYRLGFREQRMDEIWSAMLERRDNPAGDLDCETWNSTQIVSWLLDNVNLNEDESYIVDIFDQENITGERFLNLTDENLINLGVKEFGPRSEILSGIKDLKDQIKASQDYPPLPTTVKKRESSGAGVHFRIKFQLACHYYSDATPGPAWNLVLYPNGDSVALRAIYYVEFRISPNDTVRKKPYPDCPFVMDRFRLDTPKEDVEVVVRFNENVLSPADRCWKTTIPVVMEKGGSFKEEEMEVCLSEPTPEVHTVCSSIGSSIATYDGGSAVKGAWQQGPPLCFSTHVPPYQSPHQSPMTSRRTSVAKVSPITNQFNKSISNPQMAHQNSTISLRNGHNNALTAPGPPLPVNRPLSGSEGPLFNPGVTISSEQFNSVSYPTPSSGDMPTFADILSVPHRTPPVHRKQLTDANKTPTNKTVGRNRSHTVRHREETFKPFHK